VAPSALAGSWSATDNINGSNGFSAVSCIASGYCVAIDPQGSARYRNFGAGWSTPDAFDAGHELHSVSCVSSSFCAAVDLQGNAFVLQAGTWSHVSLNPGGGVQALEGVSCTSPSFCMAVDADGNSWRWDGTNWNLSLHLLNGEIFRGISCTSSTFCIAVSDTGYHLYSGTWTNSGPIGGDGGNAVSCVGPLFCVATDNLGNVFTGFEGSASQFFWGPGTPVDNWQPSSVSCASAGFCMAVDIAGRALAFNGSSWQSPPQQISNAVTYTGNPGGRNSGAPASRVGSRMAPRAPRSLRTAPASSSAATRTSRPASRRTSTC
jgi:hypothetical protein